ncbi:MAG: hypothetical protein DCF31_13125 [Alphaproteobacteria bacterium]|nr:MAG: hypothetical protein DCF31_13125 [Alphaproteobacteria bacterium]
MIALPALPDSVPLWLVGGVLVLLFVVACSIGYRVHGRLQPSVGGAGAEDETQVLSAALLLLALLIGFTFSMALGRYDTRRQIVVQEANDIGTAWLRAGLVPGEPGQMLQDRLAAYAATRVSTAANTGDPRLFAARMARGAALRREIWTLTAAAIAPDSGTAQSAALVAAVNAVLNTATTRAAAIEARVPSKVIDLLIVYAIVAAFMLGNVLAAHGSQHRVATFILFTLLAMTITLILDLDRPQSGDITISQTPLVDLVADIGRPRPSAPTPMGMP